MPAWIKNYWMLVGVVLFLSASQRKDHPFHVGVVEIEHNAKERTLELSCKLFTDDFENSLRKRFGVPVDFSDPSRKTFMDSLVARYLREQLVITINGKSLPGAYLGFEQEKEAIYSYVEYTGLGQLTQLKTDCGLLYDQFTDQVNIFHVTIGGKRQSSKISYPARQLDFRF